MLSSLLLLLLSLSASGSIVILLIYVICILLHKKLSHQWQYYIWIAAVARLLLPFSPQENLMGHLTGSLRDTNSSYENAYNEQNEPGNSSNNTYNSMNGQSSSHADTSGSLNEQSNSHYDTSGSVQEQNNSYVKSASKVKDNIVQSIKVFIKRITNKIWEYRMYLCIFWLMTAMLLFLRKITVYQDFMRFIRAGSTPVDDIGCLEALSQIEARLNIQKPIDIWSSRLITSPMLIGFRHPCIVLPEKDHLSKQAFHYTVLHELIHYKRMDLYYKWFVQLALCIHWFNPFVYAMARRINRLCELSCDEAVTARLDGVSQYREYAATLLAAMASGRDYREQVASLTLTENKQLLKERMEFIMRRKEITASKKLLTVILTAAVTVAGIYSGCCPIRASAVQEKAGQTELADTSDHAISDNATGVYA